MLRLLKSILFNTTLRIYGLRTILIFSVCASVTEWSIFPLSTPVCLATFIHHITSIIGLRFFYEIFDWILVSCEITAWFLMGITRHEYKLDPVMDESRIASFIFIYVQLALLFCLWIFRTAAIINSRGRDLFKPFNLLSGCGSNQEKLLPSWILGRRVWRTTMARRESTVIKVFRPMFALGLFSSLLLFALHAIVVAPFHEAALTPVKTVHMSDLSDDIKLAVPMWGILAFINFNATRQIDDFKAAVNVTPLWDDSMSLKPPCTHVPGNETFHLGYDENDDSSLAQAIRIDCPSRIGYDLDSRDIWNAPTRLTNPDLLISINFTALGITSDSLSGTHLSTVSIVVGLTNNPYDIIDDVVPTPLVSGSHLLGSLFMRIRKRFNKPSQASLGFGKSRTFLVGDITTLIPDPSPLIPRLDNTATLRIYVQDDPSDFVFREDYREKSVWGGFAVVGGYWTFINGAFAFVFGSSLLLILFGIKPLSVFGITHRLTGGHVRETWGNDFPLIRTEGGLPGSAGAGLVAFLREHLIELGPIGDGDMSDIENRTSVDSTSDASVTKMEMQTLVAS